MESVNHIFMKKTLVSLVLLLSISISFSQQDQADINKEVTSLLNTYLESTLTLGDDSKSVDDKKKAKKALKNMITSAYIRVVDDRVATANDSIINFRNYLKLLETSEPNFDIKLLLSKAVISSIYLDKAQNTFRATTTLKKLFKMKKLVVLDSAFVADSTPTAKPVIRYDTIVEKKLTTLIFYFKATQTPLGTFEPLKLDAIQVKGKEPVYYSKLSKLEKYWVSLSPIWQNKITEILKLPETPNDYYLKRINGIKKIDVSDIPITDMEPLKGLKGLQELDLSKVALDTLLIIEGLNNLKWLNISGNVLKSLHGIEHCTRLEYLEFSKNEITDLTPLKGCVNLMSLHLAGNKVEDLTVLKHFPHLLTLNCQNNVIADLSPLKNCLGIKVLNIGRNKDIVDLSPIKNSLAMGKLIIFNTGVTSLAPISRMTSIYELNMGYIKVTSIDQIKNLKHLTDLNISGNLITDFSALNNFSKIRKLNVSKTKVNDISPMMRMINIRELKAIHCDLSKAEIQRFKKKYPKCEITYY